jgi:hypothetical protein
MRPLPKIPLAGKLCRYTGDEDLMIVMKRVAKHVQLEIKDQGVENTRWVSFWLHSKMPLSRGDETEADGTFVYPFLLRTAEDRLILVSREGLVQKLFERLGIAGHIESPRIGVDQLARDLVFPPLQPESDKGSGRKYLIGAMWASVEGYARTLRTVQAFGDDLAEASLFREILQQSVVTRLGLRDPRSDKDLLSINSAGDLELRFRGATHLNTVDTLTRFMRANGYIEWRDGSTWAKNPPRQLASRTIGRTPSF